LQIKALSLLVSCSLLAVLSSTQFIEFSRTRNFDRNNQELSLSEKLAQAEEGTYQHPTLK